MIIQITPRVNDVLLAIIAVEQELYYNTHVAHILDYYRRMK
jgi:hypothetical protein